MKSFLIIVLIPLCVSAMDRPDRLGQPKPAAEAKSNFVELASDFFSMHILEKLLNQGVRVSTQELIGLAELVKQNDFAFWNKYGIDFLLKAALAPEQLTQALESGKIVKGSAGKLSEQARDALSTAFKIQLKELLGIAKNEDKPSPLVSFKIDEASVKKIWKELLDLGNVPVALEAVKDLRQSFESSGKKEPAIINFMIDELVNKICSNLLEITNYLKNKYLLDDLVQSLRKNYAKEIRALKSMGNDVKEMQIQQRIILGMLTANKLSCPIFVKEKVLEITQPKKGLLSTVKGLFIS
jgi:hypothetical protein